MKRIDRKRSTSTFAKKRPLKWRLIELFAWFLLSIATAVVLVLLMEEYAPPNF